MHHLYNDDRRLRPGATFSTSGSSYFNVRLTSVHHMYTVDDCARERRMLMATATMLTTEIKDCLNSDKRDLRKLLHSLKYVLLLHISDLL